MSTEALIGAILTIIFGIPSLVAYFQSLPSKLIMITDEKLDLYKEISGSVTDLEVMYKGEKIDKNSYLLKACFYYTGRSDIEADQVKKGIYLEIPNDSSWYDYKIISSSKDLTIKPRIDGQRLYFDFDLLKDEDFFYFQVFVKIKEGVESDKTFVPGHRITNLKSVIKISSKDYEKRGDNAVGAIVMGILFLAMAAFTYYLTYDSVTIGAEEEYNIKGELMSRDSLFNHQGLDVLTLFDKSEKILEKEASNELKFSDIFNTKVTKFYNINKDISVRFRIQNPFRWLIASVFLLAAICITIGFVNTLSYNKYSNILEKIKNLKKANDTQVQKS